MKAIAKFLALGSAFAPLLIASGIDEAFAHLYNCNFPAAHATIDRYIAQTPADPVGYSVKGAAYLYSELDRLNVLESEFFESDARIGDKKKLKPDPAVKEGFQRAIDRSFSMAEADLKRNANDRNALFAMCVSKGEVVDYMALIEKKQLASLSVNKEAYRYARRLLKLDPSFYDAYLTTGFTEYLLGDVPFVFRWFLKFDDVQGNKDTGLKNLQLVADKGNYMKPLAKILLAAAYLREKKFSLTQKLLQDLSHEFPANPLLKRELAKISAKM
ncbi:MAG: hypothetical protein M3Z36_15390 [Acidobacteriota bacterium]|nr:hypothetical protein [Acidobacteriota bacterium]